MRTVRLDTSRLRRCQKCGVESTAGIYRHHKGCDGFLGWYNKGIAGNYQRWIDCVDLCFDCHCVIHFHYDTIYLKLWFNKTPRGARKLHGKLIEYCDRWLEGKGQTLTPPAKYKRQFRKSLKHWEREQRAKGA